MRIFNKHGEYLSWVKKYYMVAKLKNKKIHVGWNRIVGQEKLNIYSVTFL